MADGEFAGVPWQGWQEIQHDLARFTLVATLALMLAALTLLALLRKGVLSAADLYPLAAL